MKVYTETELKKALNSRETEIILCGDIAKKYIDDRKKINVVMGIIPGVSSDDFFKLIDKIFDFVSVVLGEVFNFAKDIFKIVAEEYDVDIDSEGVKFKRKNNV